MMLLPECDGQPKKGGLTASDTIVWRSLCIHGQPTCGMCNGWTWLHFRWNWFHCLCVTKFSDKFGPFMFSHCKYPLMHLRILHFLCLAYVNVREDLGTVHFASSNPAHTGNHCGVDPYHWYHWRSSKQGVQWSIMGLSVLCKYNLQVNKRLICPMCRFFSCTH